MIARRERCGRPMEGSLSRWREVGMGGERGYGEYEDKHKHNEKWSSVETEIDLERFEQQQTARRRQRVNIDEMGDGAHG
jgi:hypothetical protein